MKFDSRSRNALIQALLSLSVSLLLLSGLGVLLYQQLRPSRMDSGDRVRVAKLGFGVNTVQRKFTREVLWDGVNREEILYLKDAIRTADDSEARVIFDDGTILDLAENSLVVLDREEEKIKIDFKGGSVFARSGGSGKSAIEISTSKGKITVGDSDGGGALSLSGNADNLKVSVESGNAKLEMKDGEVSLKENQVGKIDKDGKVDKKQLKLILKNPRMGTHFLTDKDRVFTRFLWDESKALRGRARIQIARDSTFRKPIINKRVSLTFRTALAPGQYFWRVVVQKGDRVVDESAARTFQVVRHVAPRLESPAEGEQFKFYRDTPVVRFKWSTTEDADARQKVQVSKSGRFEPKETTELSARSAGVRDSRLKWGVRADNLDTGTLYWRVVSTFDGQEKGEEPKTFFSQVRRFSLGRLDSVPAPVLSSPDNKSTIGVAEGDLVRFDWKRVAEAEEYRLRVSTDPEFSTTILDTKTKRLSWSGELESTGRVFWMVQSIEGAKLSSPKRPRVLFLTRKGGFKLVNPVDRQQFEFVRKPERIEFSWEPVGGAAGYLVQVSRSRNFVKIDASEKTRELKWISDDGLSGTLFWRVQAFGKNKKAFALSEVRSFQQIERPRIAAPEKIKPLPMFRSPANKTPKVSFEWKPVVGAKAYEFLVWRLTGNGKQIRVLAETTLEPKFQGALRSGTYRWDVLARDDVKRLGSKGKPRQFELFLTGVLPAPEPKSPAFGQFIEDKVPRPITLKWDPIKRAKSYVVTVERLDSKGNREIVLKKKTTDSEVEVLPKRNGSYRWKVAAEGIAEGSKDKKVKLGEVADSTFSVKWDQLLGAPRKVTIRFEEPDRKPAGGGKP